jgi:hypothetical protein
MPRNTADFVSSAWDARNEAISKLGPIKVDKSGVSELPKGYEHAWNIKNFYPKKKGK